MQAGPRRRRTRAEVGVWAALRLCQHGRGQAKGLEGAQKPGRAHAVQRGVGHAWRRDVVAHAAETQSRRQAAIVLVAHLPRRRHAWRGEQQARVARTASEEEAGCRAQGALSSGVAGAFPSGAPLAAHLLQRVVNQRVLVGVVRWRALARGGAPQQGQRPQRQLLLYRRGDAGIDGGDDLRWGQGGGDKEVGSSRRRQLVAPAGENVERLRVGWHGQALSCKPVGSALHACLARVAPVHLQREREASKASNELRQVTPLPVVS